LRPVIKIGEEDAKKMAYEYVNTNSDKLELTKNLEKYKKKVLIN
jgi:hypothetical protein